MHPAPPVEFWGLLHVGCRRCNPQQSSLRGFSDAGRLHRVPCTALTQIVTLYAAATDKDGGTASQAGAIQNDAPGGTAIHQQASDPVAGMSMRSVNCIWCYEQRLIVYQHWAVGNNHCCWNTTRQQGCLLNPRIAQRPLMTKRSSASHIPRLLLAPSPNMSTPAVQLCLVLRGMTGDALHRGHRQRRRAS